MHTDLINSLLELKKDPNDSGLDTSMPRLQIKSISEKGEIEGYGSVFGQVDSVNDIVAAGAFKNSIAAHIREGTSPKFLWQHDPGQPCGVWNDFKEDQRGLVLKGNFLTETRTGKEAYEFAKSGAVDGLSIGYKTLQYEYQTSTDIRVLTEVDLWEISLVTFPALRSARVTAVKSELTERRVEEILREVGFTHSQAKSMTAAWKKTLPAHRDGEGNDADLTDLLKRVQKMQALVEGRTVP